MASSSSGSQAWQRNSKLLQQRESPSPPNNHVAAASSTPPSSWHSCLVCSPNVHFRSPADFAKHLRLSHASKEGGSFVCHYGVNGVCPSLPLEGVSDRDYEDHVRKNHTMMPDDGDMGVRSSGGVRRSPSSSSFSGPTMDSFADVSTFAAPQLPAPTLDPAPKWTVYDATTNVASVLSDPHRPRPADFFTKTWGDAFGRTTVAPSPLLPPIERPHFQRYLDKTSGRCRRRREQKTLEKELARAGIVNDEGGATDEREGAFHLTTHSIQRSQEAEERKLALDTVPKIFFQPNFTLADPNTFNAVFAHWTKMSAPSMGVHDGGVSNNGRQSSKLLQEKLSHYLDIVEQAINDQIASRSDAFFHALASHDELQDHMARTTNSIQNLRAMMKKLEDVHVRQPLTVLSLAKKRETSTEVYNKLKTMSTIHATQQTIQLLLATSEYVGALDLISTTQEVLANELGGIHCFRYLGTQLSEIEKVIDKMLIEDFVAYAQSDLSRPFPIDDDDGGPYGNHSQSTEAATTEDEKDYPGIGLRFVDGGRILKASTPPTSEANAAVAAILDVDNIDDNAYLKSSTSEDSEADPLVPEEERLVALILGMLRLNKFDFIDIYKTEIASATKSLIRQTVTDRVARQPKIEIESLPEQDASVACLADEMRLMTFSQWLPLMNVIFRRIVVFLRRVKAVHGVMCDVLRLAVGKNTTGKNDEGEKDASNDDGVVGRSAEHQLPRESSSPSSHQQSNGGEHGIAVAASSSDHINDDDDSLSYQRHRHLLLPVEASCVSLNVSEEEFTKMFNRVRELLWFACDHAQDRCIKVIASRAKGGYMDKISSSEFILLCKMVESFAVACERLCGRRGTALRSSLTSQAARFVNRFHEERKTKLSLILDSERWKAAEVPTEFQRMADDAFRIGELLPPPPGKTETTISSCEQSSSSPMPPPRQYIDVGDEPFAVVGTVLLLMRMMADYCKCIRDIPSTAPEVLTKLVELLKTFNSRTCQLVMGAGALQLVGLKTISTKNLALASRSLQLALLLVTLVKRKFIDGLEGSGVGGEGLGAAAGASAMGDATATEKINRNESEDGGLRKSPPAPSRGATATANTAYHLLALTKSRRLTLTRQFQQLEKDYKDHVQLIQNKFVNIMGSMLERDLEGWETKAPVPSPAFRSLGRQLVKFHEAVVDLLPQNQIKIIFADIHDTLLNLLKGRLQRQGILNDGGPKHGLVMTELAFYLENLKSLNGLQISDFETDKVWSRE